MVQLVYGGTICITVFFSVLQGHQSDGCLFLLPGTICYHYQHVNRFDQGTDVYLLMLCSFLYYKATKIKISESDGVHYRVMLIGLTGVLDVYFSCFCCKSGMHYLNGVQLCISLDQTGFCAVTVVLLIFPFLFYVILVPFRDKEY